MDENLRLLVIGGHPADIFDHCGGTLCHHIKRGDSVTCLAMTQGLRIHDKIVSEKLRFGLDDLKEEEIQNLLAEREKIKYDDVRKACALFGITDIRFLRGRIKFEDINGNASNSAPFPSAIIVYR